MINKIGLSGFAKSGKTTAALYIEQRHGFERRHIGEPLRDMLRSLMRANGIPQDKIERYLVGDLKDGVTIPEFGVTSRHLQITIGTEWGRELVNEDLWADTWDRGVTPWERVMNDSVRFPNEEGVCDITIMIRRHGTGPAAFKWKPLGLPLGRWLYDWTGLMWGVHDSERTDRLNPTYVIDNDGTIEELYAKIDEIFDIATTIPQQDADLRQVDRERGFVPVAVAA